MCCRQRKLVTPLEIAACVPFNVRSTSVSCVSFAVLYYQLSGVTCSMGAPNCSELFNVALSETLPEPTEALTVLHLDFCACSYPQHKSCTKMLTRSWMWGWGSWKGLAAAHAGAAGLAHGAA